MQRSHIFSDSDIRRDVDALCLGEKIRKLRKRRGMTLQEVSDICGLSKSLLSQIENETSAPPIPTLMRIARSLGVTIGYFFQEADNRQQLSVVRENDRRETVRLPHNRPKQSGYRYFSLAHPVINQHMEPFWVRFESRAESSGTFYQHPGEEFLYVQKGELEFKTEGDSIVLTPGDSLYFKSRIPHMVRNVGEDPAYAVAVIYTPKE
jgi:transcriptional regulator with XRE-family HTH domain